MDVEAVRGLARLMLQSGSELESVQGVVRSALLSVSWRGHDADAFQQVWEQRHGPVLSAAAAGLYEVSQRLESEAAEQVAASESDGRGGPAGPGGTSAGPGPGRPPSGGSPADNAAWWGSLSPMDRAQLLRDHPEWLGRLDGLPAAVRDDANRAWLGDERARLEAQRDRLRADLADNRFGGWFTNADAALENTEAKLEALDRIEYVLKQDNRQLLVLDTRGDLVRAAIAVGDVDTADHVAVFTPGFTSNVQDSLERYDRDMDRLQQRTLDELDRAGRDETVATVAWLGYAAPQAGWDLVNPDRSVANDNAAREGGQDLATFLDGINASRPSDPHLTALGHSYGSTTTGFGLQEASGVDDAVFFGSPGLSVNDVDDLNVPSGHVHVIEARRDPVADAGHFGTDPNLLPGQVPLSARETVLPDGRRLTESVGHSEYVRPGTTSQYNIAVVVGGMPDRQVVGTGFGAGDVLVPGLRSGLP
ncbi:alpha/beta hydrolase [Blastococcus sp. SYSU D00820]